MPVGEGLRAVENTDKVLYLALPPKPGVELSDEQFDQVAGGDTAGTLASLGSIGTLVGSLSSVSSVGTYGTAG